MMDEGEEITPLTKSEADALKARRDNGEEIAFTLEEQAYMESELLRLRRAVKDLLVNRLMQANQVSREARAEDELEVAAGLSQDLHVDIYDALDKAIADTAVHVSNLDENTSDHISLAALRAFVEECGKHANDYYEYEGYRLLAKFFKD